MRRARTPSAPTVDSGVASTAEMGSQLGRMKIASTAIEPPDDEGGYRVGPDFPGQYSDDEACSARMIREWSRWRPAPSSGGSRSVIECVICERRCGTRREAVWCEHCECFYCRDRCASVCPRCGGEACPFCLCGCRPEDDEADSITQWQQHVLPSREHRGDGDGWHGGDVSMGRSSTDECQDTGEDRRDRTGEQSVMGSNDEAWCERCGALPRRPEPLNRCQE